MEGISSGCSMRDPLMITYGTLFTQIQNAVRICGQVRFTVADRAGLLRSAQMLKRDIDLWNPSTMLHTSWSIEDSQALDLLHACRAATIVYMCQVLPELREPSLQSTHQTVLGHLTTILHKSRFTILQVYPLLIAGGEANTSDSRAWVKEAWQGIGQKTWVISVHKCFAITQEVWRRRDGFHPRTKFSKIHILWQDVGTLRKDAQHEYCEDNWMDVMKDWRWETPF
jgi:hypothetical protein